MMMAHPPQLPQSCDRADAVGGTWQHRGGLPLLCRASQPRGGSSRPAPRELNGPADYRRPRAPPGEGDVDSETPSEPILPNWETGLTPGSVTSHNRHLMKKRVEHGPQRAGVAQETE